MYRIRYLILYVFFFTNVNNAYYIMNIMNYDIMYKCIILLVMYIVYTIYELGHL